MKRSFSPFCFFLGLLLIAASIVSTDPAGMVLSAESYFTEQSASDPSAIEEIRSSTNLNGLFAQDAAQGMKVPSTFKEPSIAAQFAVLMDAVTGQVLYKKNENGQAFPASITKIMTLLLVVEHSKPDDLVEVTREAVRGIKSDEANIALQPGERITIEQALSAIALASANDVANVVAEVIGGSLPVFAQMMTDRAKEIGALNTRFTNSNGLQNANHYTTAYDMALITREALKNESFRSYFSRIEYTMQPNNLQPESRYFLTHHKMLYNTKYRYKYAFAGKTGYTSDAGSTLVTVASKDGRELICVSLKESAVDAYADARTLFEYGFNQFESILLPASMYGDSTLDVLDDNRRIGSARFQEPRDSAILVPSCSGSTLSMIRMNPVNLNFKGADGDILDSSIGSAFIKISIPELTTPFYDASFVLPLQAKVTLDPIATPTPVPGSANETTGERSIWTILLLGLAGILLLGVTAYILYVGIMIFRTGYYKKWLKKIKKTKIRHKKRLNAPRDGYRSHPKVRKTHIPK